MERLKRALVAFFVLSLMFISGLYAQNSNIGTEFWTGYMDHVNGITGSSGSQMNLYIASDVATTVTISCSDGSFTNTVNVTPGVITTFAVPTTTFLGNANGIANKGIHIVSQKPVAVYAHIYASSVSGATLLLPVNTLSNDYYSINYTQLSNATTAAPAYSAFMVIATEDSTSVQITPGAKLNDGSVANTPFTVMLQKGQIYQGLSTSDLTGTRILSVSTGTQNCKKIAVFSGSSKIKIGTPAATSDNLFQQVYPAPSWGKNYVTVPLKARNYDVYRVVVSDPAAIVKVDGVLITSAPTSATLINKFYYEFNSQLPHFITADKPIQVVQYAVTQGNEINGTSTDKNDVGDPEMIYLNPLEQNIDHVTLYSPYEYKILASYINVVIPTSLTSSFLLDGANPGGFSVVPTNTAYSYGQFTVSNTTHNISASGGFNATAYGFGNAESYGYAAGTNVKNLNEFVQVINPANNKITNTGCTNANYNPQVALPYKPLSLNWDAGNGSATVIQTNPAYKDTLHRNDTTLYVYDYGKPINYPVGNYAIKVIAVDPISTVCGSTDEIDLSYTVVDPPMAKFSSRDTVCLADTAGFKDQTPAAIAVKTWHWDFGGGVSDTSNLQNPVHAFLKPGLSVVTLTVTGASGCNTSYSKNVYVRPLPVPEFRVSSPTCTAPSSVTFTDQSKTNEGKIVSWYWDFGDSNTSLLQNPTHAFASSQSYPVTLIVTTDKGCSNNIKQNVLINYSPIVNFTLPDVCEKDNFAHFTAISTVTDSTTDALFYDWDFGDAANTASPNTATGKAVQHHFSGVGVYNIKLTVTTANGCVKDTIKQLTVNGGNPKAAFTVNKYTCSNQPVVFTNRAYVEGNFEEGKVTSFKFDFGDGTPVKTMRIDSGKSFMHYYPEVNTGQKSYIVSMVAYSGTTCFTPPLYDTLYVLPVPKTTFNLPAKVCSNAGALQLANYVIPNGGVVTGTAQFLIDGITTKSGLFNTGTVGLGLHTITCYYITNATGCADTTIKNIIVEPVATVDAGADLYMLAGGQIQIKAVATGGNNLTYSWYPAKGLSNSKIIRPTASPLVTTKYYLTATSTTDSLACPVTDSVNVIVLQAPVIPNTFTPNGDGTNDYWVIDNLDSYPGCIVEVFNRNGQKVFYSIGYGTPWDGRYNSVNLPIGTYYYIIDPKNGRSKLSGSITIIR